MSKLDHLRPSGLHHNPAYSHVVTAQGASKLVFCAGQVAADPTGKVLPPDDFAAQTKMVMENLRLALAEVGAALKDVVKVTIFICNPHDVPKARAILQEYFGDNPRQARFACCAVWPIRISCWRSKQSRPFEASRARSWTP